MDAVAARGIGLVVIPRWNVRAGQMRWDVEKTVVLPGNLHVELLDTHLRQTDFTYCNLFTNAEGACNIAVSGVGNALVDTGKPNGLKVKNAGKLGFGPITDKKKYIGMVLQLDRLETDDLTLRDVFIDRVGQGGRMNGGAAVEITGLQAGELGRTLAVCGSNCSLQINREQIPITAIQAL